MIKLSNVLPIWTSFVTMSIMVKFHWAKHQVELNTSWADNKKIGPRSYIVSIMEGLIWNKESYMTFLAKCKVITRKFQKKTCAPKINVIAREMFLLHMRSAQCFRRYEFEIKRTSFRAEVCVTQVRAVVPLSRRD